MYNMHCALYYIYSTLLFMILPCLGTHTYYVVGGGGPLMFIKQGTFSVVNIIEV